MAQVMAYIPALCGKTR